MTKKMCGIGLEVEQQKPLPLFFENKRVGKQVVDLLIIHEPNLIL